MKILTRKQQNFIIEKIVKSQRLFVEHDYKSAKQFAENNNEILLLIGGYDAMQEVHMQAIKDFVEFIGKR